jgi:hypothetical protein
MTLDKHFKYWDNFIKIWKRVDSASAFELQQRNLINKYFPKLSPNKVEQLVFKFPDKIFNHPDEKNYTYDFLPEPYWGYTLKSKMPLEYVVINYNPGSGGPCQGRKNENIMNLDSYEIYVKKQVECYSKLILTGNLRNKKSKKPSQFKTTNWHNSSRAHRLSQLDSKSPTLYYLTKTHPAVCHYLGIDLVPWHTKGVKDLGSYIEDNAKAVMNLSLNFAIEAAKRIVNPIFKNKIIMRTSLDNFIKYFPDKNFNYQVHNPPKSNADCNYNIRKVTLNEYQNTELILVWGKHSRNNLPNHEFMCKVLK